jgi:hypothetical protein
MIRMSSPRNNQVEMLNKYGKLKRYSLLLQARVYLLQARIEGEESYSLDLKQ